MGFHPRFLAALRESSLETVMRRDEPLVSFAREDILANAPWQEGDFFRVRAVLEE